MAQFIKIYENKPNKPQSQSGEGAKERFSDLSIPFMVWVCDITNTKALERIARLKG
jgi:hypothetical protein